MGKHRWTFDDDYKCCMEYLNFVFVKEGFHPLGELVEAMALKLPYIDKGSLRMKAQNIKQIALDQGLEDSLGFSPLSNYSEQCKRAFNKASIDFESIMEKLGQTSKGYSDKHDKFDLDLVDEVSNGLSRFFKKDNRLIGLTVFHPQYGMGKIENIAEKQISVKFLAKTASFVYPDAFGKFLRFENPLYQKGVELHLECQKEIYYRTLVY